MKDATMNDVERRLAKLEAQVGRWRRATMALVVCGVAAVSLGAARAQETFDVLRTRRLEVLREDGRPAVVVAADPAGGGLVQLRRGENAEVVLALAAGESGGAVRLSTGGAPGTRKYGELAPTHWRVHGTSDQTLWEVREAESGGGALVLSDAEGAPAVRLDAVADGTGRAAVADGGEELRELATAGPTTVDLLRVRALELVGEGDAVIGALGKNEAGGGSFELRAKEGGAVVVLGQGPAGHGRVEARSRTGDAACEVGATTLGEGAVTVYGRRARPLVRLMPESEGQLPLGGACVISNYAGDEVVRLGVDTDGAGEFGVYEREGEPRFQVPR